MKNEKRCKLHTQKQTRQCPVSSYLLPLLVMVDNVPITELGGVFSALMPLEYPYCAFRT